MAAWRFTSQLGRRLLHNLPQKLVAVILAVIVWYVATANQRAISERTFTVPLQVIDQSAGATKRTVSDLPSQVTITLSGQTLALDQLRAANIQADVNISSLGSGPFQQKVHLVTPDGETVVAVKPARVAGIIQALISKTFPVQVSALGIPSNQLIRLTSRPTQAVASGAEQQISLIGEVVTSPEALTDGSSQRVPLIALGTNGLPVSKVTISPSTVTVSRVDIGTLPVRTVGLQLASLPKTWTASQVRFSPSTIRLLGPNRLLSRIGTVTIKVPLRPGTYSTPGTPVLPSGVVSLDLVTVTLTLVHH